MKSATFKINREDFNIAHVKHNIEWAPYYEYCLYLTKNK